jgi:hypothetical protein
MVQQPLVGQGLLMTDVSRSHSDTPPVGLLWTSDQPDAETSTWQHTTHTRDRHPCPRRDSNPQSQQGNGRRPTPYWARPLGSDVCTIKFSLILEKNLQSQAISCKITLVFRILFSFSRPAFICVFCDYVIHDKFWFTETLKSLGILNFATSQWSRKLPFDQRQQTTWL